jgi:hypothetical protein
MNHTGKHEIVGIKGWAVVLTLLPISFVILKNQSPYEN